MWQIRKTIDIEQPPERIFGYLSRFHHIPEWDRTVLAAWKLSPGPPAVGTRFRLVLLLGMQRVPMTYRIVALQYPSGIVLEGSGATFDAVDRISFETTAAGTRVTYQAEVRFHRPPGRLADRSLGMLFGWSAGRTMRRLKALMTPSPRPPRLTPLTRMSDRAILPGMTGFTRAGWYLARGRRPVAAALYAGRTMVLTGGTSGIGRAAAGALYRRGADLVVVGRSADKLADLERELAATGGDGTLTTERADLGRLSEVRALAHRLQERHGTIDVLINNAGALFNTYGETTEGVERTLATDLASPYLLTRLLLSSLSAAENGRIINVASGGMYTQGIDPLHLHADPAHYDGPTAYARAKRGLVILTDVWARELASRGISVHAMHPGWVDTPGLRRSLPGFHRQLSRWLRTPAQGADTIVWLAASPDAAAASGQFWLDRKIRATVVFPGTRPAPGDGRRLVRSLDALIGQVS